MSISKNQKRHVFIWISIIVAFLLTFGVAVHMHEVRTTTEKSIMYMGTYALGEQTDDDCIYIVVGDILESGKQGVVIYRQQDEKHVQSGIAERTENQLVLNKPKLIIKETSNGTQIQYKGQAYSVDKISDIPTFAANNAASNQFFKYYKK